MCKPLRHWVSIQPVEDRIEDGIEEKSKRAYHYHHHSLKFAAFIGKSLLGCATPNAEVIGWRNRLLCVDQSDRIHSIALSSSRNTYMFVLS